MISTKCVESLNAVVVYLITFARYKSCVAELNAPLHAGMITIEFVYVYLFVAVLQVAMYRSRGPRAFFRILTPKQLNGTQCHERNARRSSVRFVACCQTFLTCWHSF